MTNCKICGAEAQFLFETLLLKKYNVTYYKCKNCEFIQTEKPYWLDEAYSAAITTQDIGLLSRNLNIYPILSLLIRNFFNKAGKFVDYGGGYGVLTRLMRDFGFNFFRFDTYCENIFAKDFDCESEPNKADFELLTAFEVFEHLDDPQSEIKKMLSWSDSIFFSTHVQPGSIKSPLDWWYVMPETGQHIALYTKKSLKILANTNGLNYYTNGVDLHLFTVKEISTIKLKILFNYRYSKILNTLFPNRISFLLQDYNGLKSID